MADGVSAPIGCTSTCTFFAVRLADAYSGNCTASCFDWMPSADGLHRVHNGLSHSDLRDSMPSADGLLLPICCLNLRAPSADLQVNVWRLRTLTSRLCVLFFLSRLDAHRDSLLAAHSNISEGAQHEFNRAWNSHGLSSDW